MAYLFIQNPQSGSRKAAWVRQLITSYCTAHGVEHDYWLWEDPNALDARMAQAVRQGYQAIVAVGGDGTLNHVGRYLIGTDIALGVVPVGTGNSLANHIGLPHSVSGTLRHLLAGHTVTVDTGLMNGQPFVGFFGFGLDAEVAHAFARTQERSLAQYISLAAQKYTHFQPEDIILEANGHLYHWPVAVLAVLNINQYGHKAIITKKARMTDGLLDVVGVPHFTPLQIPEMFGRVFGGTLPGLPGYRGIQATQVLIDRGRAKGLAQIDGEPITTGRYIEIECVPASLRLLVPRGTRPANV